MPAVLAVALAGCGLGRVDPLPQPASSEHFADDRVDVEYAKLSGAQHLDLYVPSGAAPSPVVVLIHGGFWTAGDKGDFGGATISAFTAAGYAVATINYRLAAEAQWPAAIQDAKAAVRWLRANATTFHLDPDRFAAVGSSSGGYLAAALGVTGGERTVFDDARLADPATAAGVRAAVLWSSPVTFATMDKQLAAADCPLSAQFHGLPQSAESKWLGETVGGDTGTVRESDLLLYVSRDRPPPPFLLLHGAKDCVVPAAQAKALHEELRAAKAQSTLKLVGGKPSKTHDDTKLAQLYLKPTLEFLNQVFR